MKNTQLLLINDMCGYGKVALSAMLPVLSHMGYRIHNLPTALVSDTLNYPSSTSTTPRSMSARASPSGRSSALSSTPSRPALS
ncbi:MAG: hypothetical protein ACLTYW_07130 [Collinsella sp.]